MMLNRGDRPRGAVRSLSIFAVVVAAMSCSPDHSHPVIPGGGIDDDFFFALSPTGLYQTVFIVKSPQMENIPSTLTVTTQVKDSSSLPVTIIVRACQLLNEDVPSTYPLLQSTSNPSDCGGVLEDTLTLQPHEWSQSVSATFSMKGGTGELTEIPVRFVLNPEFRVPIKVRAP